MWTLHRVKAAHRRTANQSSPNSAFHEPPETTGQISLNNTNPGSTWDFSSDELMSFPALRKRNFWCIQRHQARGVCLCCACSWSALHYDLRLQLDGKTVSWAIPRGLLGRSDEVRTHVAGLDRHAASHHLAIETTLHPISYTTHEGMFYITSTTDEL
jgi:hypothetical protein